MIPSILPAPRPITHAEDPFALKFHDDNPTPHAHIIREDWSIILKNRLAGHIDRYHSVPELQGGSNPNDPGPGTRVW